MLSLLIVHGKEEKMIIKKEINLEVEYDVNTGKISFELDVDMLKNSKKAENKKLLSIAVDEWFSYIQQSIEQTTYESYIILFKHVKKHFHDCYLQDITEKSVQDFVTALNGTIGANTIRKVIGRFKAMLEYACKTKQIQQNPASNILLPKKTTFTNNYYTVTNLKQLIAISQNTNIHIPIVLASIYGLRRGEILGLKWKDIDFDNKTIKICETRVRTLSYVEKKTKNDKIKLLPLLPFIEKILINYKKGACYNKIYVCTNSNREPLGINYLSKQFQEIIKSSVLPPIRLHDLRHSTATFLVNAGIHIKDIQDWLGHTDYSTTANIYSHTNMSNKLRIADTIKNLFNF